MYGVGGAQPSSWHVGLIGVGKSATDSALSVPGNVPRKDLQFNFLWLELLEMFERRESLTQLGLVNSGTSHSVAATYGCFTRFYVRHNTPRGNLHHHPDCRQKSS